MNSERYTPGHTQNTTDFMSKRTLASHGQFFAEFFQSGGVILDCGCGPGTITLDIAEAVAPGHVTGVDFGASQIEKAKGSAKIGGVENVTFQVASCYELPFAEASFDGIFCHALVEHLAEPVKALRDMGRVLKPEGTIGLCSPDFGGMLLAPPSDDLTAAVAAYATLQASNGGDLHVGHKLAGYLAQAGFREITMSARYECYPSLRFIGEYLALQLEQDKQHDHARTLRDWSNSKVGMFAQAWVSAIGRK